MQQQIIKYLYSNIDLSKYKYEMLSDDFTKLSTTKFFVGGNYYGKNCLLIFMKSTVALIDRKTLKFNKTKVNVNDVDIKILNIKTHDILHNGAIIDGTYIQNKGKDVFIANDVYFFNTFDISKMGLIEKLMLLKKYLELESDEINILVGDVFDISFAEKIKATSKYLIRGLCFYPEYEKTKYIYLFKSKQETKPPVINTKKIYKYIPKQMDVDIYAIFEMKEKDISDVYKLYAIEQKIEGGRLVYKKIFMGIAYIQNIAKSQWCKSIIKTEKLVKCKYNFKNSAWEPISVEHDQLIPTDIKEIEKNMIMIEDE